MDILTFNLILVMIVFNLQNLILFFKYFPWQHVSIILNKSSVSDNMLGDCYVALRGDRCERVNCRFNHNFGDFSARY